MCKFICIQEYRVLWVYEKEWYSWDIWEYYSQFLKNFHTDFHKDCPTLHSHQGKYVLFFFLFRRFHQYWLSSFFLMMAILTGVRWNFIVVFFLIYFFFILAFHLNSLMDNDIEQVFKCLFTIFISSSENYLFIYVACIYWVVDFSCFIP